MYSATFAMTVIVGIAVMNLGFGFMLARLMGRGPRRWSDLSVTVRIQHLRWRRRHVVAADPTETPCQMPTGADLPEDPPPSGATPVDELPACETPCEPELAPTPEVADQPAAPSPPAAPEPLVSPPETELPPEADLPPEEVLQSELEKWHSEESFDGMPSATVLVVKPQADGLSDSTLASLHHAVRQTIASQLRRDRRIVQPAANEFAWFSNDISVEDALLPAQRIRHMLAHTDYENQGSCFHIAVSLAVVSVMTTDDALAVIDRLRATADYAQEHTDARAAQDIGTGPDSVDAVEIDVEPSSPVLLTS